MREEQFSSQYLYVYALAIALNVMLLLWTIVESDYPLGHVAKFWIFVIFDVFVTLFVVFEILVSLLAQGLAVFCSICHNRVDIIVALFCMVALLGHLLGPTSVQLRSHRAQLAPRPLATPNPPPRIPV